MYTRIRIALLVLLALLCAQAAAEIPCTTDCPPPAGCSGGCSGCTMTVKACQISSSKTEVTMSVTCGGQQIISDTSTADSGTNMKFTRGGSNGSQNCRVCVEPDTGKNWGQVSVCSDMKINCGSGCS